MRRILPPPRDYPVLLDNAEFEQWLCSAKAGSWCAYRVLKSGDEAFLNWNASRVRMGKALYAHETGSVVLAQRRAEPGALHYLAKRIAKEHLDKRRSC